MKYYTLYSVLIGMLSSVIYGQNSSQVSDYIDLGFLNRKNSHGKYQYEVPLCSVSKDGFTINLGAHYTTQDFKYNRRESELGLNWFLNGSGGVITRRVNGVEDELRDDRVAEVKRFPAEKSYRGTHNEINVDGFLTAYRKHKDVLFDRPVAIKSLEQVEKRSFSEVLDSKSIDIRYSIFQYYNSRDIGNTYRPLVGRPDYGSTDLFELSLDEFTFNFMGIVGKFYIGPDGKARVVSDTEMQVDLTGLAEQPAEPGKFDVNRPKNSSIVITLKNGYRYFFGGTIDALEWTNESKKVSYRGDINLENRPVITAWNLTRIEAPNTNFVDFVYNTYNPDDPCSREELHTDGVDCITPGTTNKALRIIQVERSEYLAEVEPSPFVEDPDPNYRDDVRLVAIDVKNEDFRYLKEAALKSININNKARIDFAYEQYQNRQDVIVDNTLPFSITERRVRYPKYNGYKTRGNKLTDISITGDYLQGKLTL